MDQVEEEEEDSKNKRLENVLSKITHHDYSQYFLSQSIFTVVQVVIVMEEI